MAYGITSKSQIIDITQINRGCDVLETVAGCLKKYGGEVANISKICDEKALSADGKSNVKAIEEKGNSIINRGKAIEKYTSELRELAQGIKRSQDSEYASYLAKLKEDN